MKGDVPAAAVRLVASLPVRTHLAAVSKAPEGRGADLLPRKLQSETPCARTLKNREKREERIAAQFI